MDVETVSSVGNDGKPGSPYASLTEISIVLNHLNLAGKFKMENECLSGF